MARRSPDSRELRTKEEVMAALGGIQGLCALTGSGYGAVENWKRLETFPSRYFLLMTFALHKKGLGAPPELWGQVTPAERKQALTALIAEQKRRVAA
jgi:hypothetical protein